MFLGELGNLIAYSVEQESTGFRSDHDHAVGKTIIDFTSGGDICEEHEGADMGLLGCDHVVCSKTDDVIFQVVANNTSEHETLTVEQFQNMAFRPNFMGSNQFGNLLPFAIFPILALTLVLQASCHTCFISPLMIGQVLALGFLKGSDPNFVQEKSFQLTTSSLPHALSWGVQSCENCLVDPFTSPCKAILLFSLLPSGMAISQIRARRTSWYRACSNAIFFRSLSSQQPWQARGPGLPLELPSDICRSLSGPVSQFACDCLNDWQVANQKDSKTHNHRTSGEVCLPSYPKCTLTVRNLSSTFGH
eukprot:755755-Hanusia_phi.AAC.3